MQLQLIIPENRKQCPRCHEDKPITDFYADRSNADGRFSWCKTCTNENQKAYRQSDHGRSVSYATHKRYRERKAGIDTPIRNAQEGTFVRSPRAEQQMNAKNKRRYNRRLFVKLVKEYSGCALCGEMFRESLDYHHVNPSEKAFALGHSNVSIDRPIVRIVQEMMKCVILCSTCHRKVHADAVSVEECPRVSLSVVERALGESGVQCLRQSRVLKQ